ncbi:MAG: 30S ribosomal protein S8 [Dehalococcoidia bacterium]
MSLSDPIADMLTRIRNASSARHDSVLMPASKIKVAIAGVLKEEGFIKDYSVALEEGKAQANLKVDLSYGGGRRQPVLNGLQRVSKPGLRVYVQRREVPRVYGGLGMAILSTPKGVMSGQEARRNEVGGEVICYVW